MQETWVRSLGLEVPLEKEMATHSSILAWKIPWTEESSRRQFMGSQRVGHDWATSLRYITRASQVALVVNSLPANAGDVRDSGSISGSEDPLEEGMATHSSVLAWRILWTEKTGGLQSIGLWRVGQDWSNSVCTHACYITMTVVENVQKSVWESRHVVSSSSA